MQKLSGKSMVVLHKVVGLATGNPTKLDLHFYDLSFIFYKFSKFQPKSFTI
jgi:hypothetical protein